MLRRGNTTVALVSLDVVGFFYDDVEEEVREQVSAQGLDVDHVMISATHNHEAPDTLGQWGRMVETSEGGRGLALETLKDQVVVSIAQAVEGLTPVTLATTTVDLSQVVPEKGTRNFINDKRDPRIVDEAMEVAVFRATDDGRTVATLVNQGNHLEALADENTAITSDFAHYVRDGMENGRLGERRGRGTRRRERLPAGRGRRHDDPARRRGHRPGRRHPQRVGLRKGPGARSHDGDRRSRGDRRRAACSIAGPSGSPSLG